MASCAVSVARPAPLPIGKFSGDADDLLDKLVAACAQATQVQRGTPGAWGRSLKPYFVEPVPGPEQGAAAIPDHSTRASSSSQSSSRKQGRASPRSSRSASPSSKSGKHSPRRDVSPVTLRPQLSTETFSTGFLAPKPEEVPIPSFLL